MESVECVTFIGSRRNDCIDDIKLVLHNTIATDVEHLGRNASKDTMYQVAKGDVLKGVVNIVQAKKVMETIFCLGCMEVGQGDKFALPDLVGHLR
jgi:hypothetical protein